MSCATLVRSYTGVRALMGAVMATIMVTFGEVEEGRQAVLKLCTGLEQNLEKLDKLLAPLKADWTGAAAEAYGAAYARWRAEADAMHGDITWIHSMVCNAQVNYAAAHTAVLSTWQAD